MLCFTPVFADGRSHVCIDHMLQTVKEKQDWQIHCHFHRYSILFKMHCSVHYWVWVVRLISSSREGWLLPFWSWDPASFLSSESWGLLPQCYATWVWSWSLSRSSDKINNTWSFLSMPTLHHLYIIHKNGDNFSLPFCLYWAN